METGWPFPDPPNVAVFTTGSILNVGKPILRVCHDEEDGAWQFLDGGPARLEDALLVSLETVLRHDPSIAELADLPVGWKASRAAAGSAWTRTPSEPD